MEMNRIELIIYQAGTETKRASANKWKFQDSMMGEQFITCTVTSEKPIPWAIGDYCVFRGQTYTLNYIPTVIQKARTGELGDAYTYDNIKFDSRQEELTRCIMLDITPTTGDYVAALGTNYTGSSRFQLFCGETSVIIDGNAVTLTPVCALAAKMQANLDRFYPTLGWRIHIDTTTTYNTATGATMLVTHTDDKMLSFDNTTVAQALAEVHNTFKLDYCIKGREIFIGYTLGGLTSDNEQEIFSFGYGKGYPTVGNSGKGLFQIKQMSDSQQKIVTRLRALGSTKNMPYRYYNKKYASEQNPALSQTLFPTNLQLPTTFLPEGDPSDEADINGSTKWAQNNARGGMLNAVLGDTNDAYIDKNDDAAGCIEGIREDCARWDGSNGDLPEIYPTIEGVIFGELRSAGVPDQTGATGNGSYQGTSVHPSKERIDRLLAVGYTSDGVLIDDANKGDGILPEENSTNGATPYPAKISQKTYRYTGRESISGTSLPLGQTTLFTVNDVVPGRYFMVPTGPSYDSVIFNFKLTSSSTAMASVGYIIRVKQVVNGSSTTIATYLSPSRPASNNVSTEMALPELPDSKDAPNDQVQSITVSEFCNIEVTFEPVLSSIVGESFSLIYSVGKSKLDPSEYDSEYNWGSVDDYSAVGDTFHVFIKDVGFNPAATFNGDTPVLAMKSGSCVGREFTINDNVQVASVNGVNGYLLTLTRATDSSLNTYYPSATDPIAAGDYFVLLGISMPDAYIRTAEIRLLQAASDYLADNCDTKYTYQPSIDDIYLQRNLDNMRAEGREEDSIFWRLYAGLKFLFRGIPASEDAPLPLIDITIMQVTITMGEGLTPKVEIVLNDDVQQSTIQRLTTAVDRIYNGTGSGNNFGSAALYELLVNDGGKMFLSKIKDDVAAGKITFKDVLTAFATVKARNGAEFGSFMPGFLGDGAMIDSEGKAEFEEVNVRGSLRASELVFNLIDAEEGEAIRSIGHGEIETVEITSETTGTATLKLDGNQWATIDVGDICRGMYNTIDKDYDNADVSGTDDNGFQNKKGFFSSYFLVTSVTSEMGSCSFTYELQEDTTEHPCPLMRFAAYGNVNNNKSDRQSCMYISAVGIAPRVLFLSHVNDWEIKPNNIKIAIGNIEGLQVWEECTQAEYDEELVEENKNTWVDENNITHWSKLKALHGIAGFYCEQNIYLGGIISQFVSAATDAIESQISNLGQAWVYSDKSSVIVDCTEEGYTIEETQIGLQAALYFGNEQCTLNNSECWFDGLNSTSHPDNIFANTAYKSYTIPQGTLLNSQIISINLVGTHNGSTYIGSKSITVFSQRQGSSGGNGQSVAKISTDIESAYINCSPDGKVSARTQVTISAELFIGKDKQTTLDSYSMAWLSGTGNQVTPTAGSDGFVNGTFTKTFTFAKNTSNTLKTSHILITMSGGGYTEQKRITIVPVLSGTAGQSSFVSFVFARSASKPTPQPQGGDFDSPYPTTPANTWFDYIPIGTLPIWFSKCLFTSDGLSPQGDWSEPKLLADNDSFDVEFSPSKSRPDNPNDTNRHDGSGTQVWFDPKLDASHFTESSPEMIWMAINTKVVNAQGNPEWSGWVVSKIKGEDGAGYSANLTRNGDNLIVDAANNIIVGYADRLYTTVDIWENNKERSLTYKSSGNLTDGKYSIALENKVNCDASVDSNGKVTITSIADASLDGCSVGIVVTTYDGVVMHFTYSVTFTHIDQTYLTFALTNEYDSISYRTQVSQYAGLPVETTIEAYENSVDGNEKIGTDTTKGYLKSVTVESIDENILIGTRPGNASNSVTVATNATDGVNYSSQTYYIYTLIDGTKYTTGLRLYVNSNGLVKILKDVNQDVDRDMADAKHRFDISCVVRYGNADYNSPKKRLTLSEKTDSTIYRLLLSATAISKEETTFTPATIDVNASITDEQGTQVYTAAQLEQSGNIKVRYIYGVYNTSGSNTLESSFPVLTSYSNKVITVVLVDLTDTNNPVYLDIQTITINEGGKDGAGQSYIDCSPTQFTVDCDKDGKPLRQQKFTVKARLKWGDDLCEITNPTSANNITYSVVGTTTTTYSSSAQSNLTNGVPTMSNVVYSNGYVQRTFTFELNEVYTSGYITVSLDGATGTGSSIEEHTATQTISVHINRKGSDGQQGNTGRGIVGISTYYKAFPTMSSVEVPEDPIQSQWVEGYVEPTEENPFLWRFTRTYYTDSTHDDTDAEFVGMWSDVVNTNLLDDTDFIDDNHLSAWYAKGAINPSYPEASIQQNYYSTASYRPLMGQRQFYARVKTIGTNGDDVTWYQLLCQRLITASGVSRVEAGRWYTFSFWVLYYRTTQNSGQTPRIIINLEDVCDNNGVFYCDGTQTSSYLCEFILPDSASQNEAQWVRHTVTFQTKSILSGDLSLRLETRTMSDLQMFYICMPKLEVGKMATRYTSKAVVSNPFPRTSNWEIGKQYYQGAQGEPYLDIVRYNGQWNRCRVTHVSDENNAPVEDTITAFWEQATDLSFISTDLILANIALIENLVARSLRTGERGPHVEMNGNTVAFYGDLDTPSIELTTGAGGVGVLRFYNADGTIAYDLGPNSITQQYHDVDSIFRETYFKAISGNSLVDAVIRYSGGHVIGIATSQCDEYYWFIEGYVAVGNNSNSPIEYRVSGGTSPSAYDKKYLNFGAYAATDTNIKNNRATVIEDGWYVMANSVVSSGDNMVTTNLHKVVNGKIVRSVSIYIKDNGQEHYTYYDADGNSHRYLSEVMNSTIPDFDRE